MLTVQEAAVQAGVTEMAIRNAIHRGRLSFVKLYGRTLIERPVLENYLETKKVGRPAGSKNKGQETEQ